MFDVVHLIMDRDKFHHVSNIFLVCTHMHSIFTFMFGTHRSVAQANVAADEAAERAIAVRAKPPSRRQGTGTGTGGGRAGTAK